MIIIFIGDKGLCYIQVVRKIAISRDSQRFHFLALD
jgi:hypothetical protein